MKLVSHLSNTKIPTLCIMGKLEWLIYTAAFGLGFRFGFRLQTQCLHYTMQKLSHRADSDSDSNPIHARVCLAQCR